MDLEGELRNKVTSAELKDRLEGKLDCKVFERTFPNNDKNASPLDTLRIMINDECESVKSQCTAMLLAWDKKIVALRKDMNMTTVYKRLDGMAEKYKVDDALEASVKRIEIVEKR